MTCNIENSWLKYPLTVKLKTLRTDDVNILTLIYFLSQGQLFKILLGYYKRIIQHTDFTFVLKIDGKKMNHAKDFDYNLIFLFQGHNKNFLICFDSRTSDLKQKTIYVH